MQNPPKSGKRRWKKRKKKRNLLYIKDETRRKQEWLFMTPKKLTINIFSLSFYLLYKRLGKEEKKTHGLHYFSLSIKTFNLWTFMSVFFLENRSPFARWEITIKVEIITVFFFFFFFFFFSRWDLKKKKMRLLRIFEVCLKGINQSSFFSEENLKFLYLKSN